MFGGDLADELLVDAFDLDLGVVGDGDLDALGDREKHGVRIAKAQVQLLALDGGLETDALDLELLVVSHRSRR